MSSLLAHVTPHEFPAGLLTFVAGMAAGIALATVALRLRRPR